MSGKFGKKEKILRPQDRENPKKQKKDRPIFKDLSFDFTEKSVGRVGQKTQLTSAFDGFGQGSLMVSAGSGDATGQDLASFAHKLAQFCNILIVDGAGGVGTELADLLAGLSLEVPGSSFGAFCGSSGLNGSVCIIFHDGSILS